MRHTKYDIRNTRHGFSLTEVLIAIGILAVGLLFVAGTFPVGIYFTAVAAEKTTAAVVADEAFAKIKLYGVNLANTALWPSPDPTAACRDFRDVALSIPPYPDEFLYPSVSATSLPSTQQKQYSWSAICRRMSGSNNLVQVTVFVSRKVGAGSTYPDGAGVSNWPVPQIVNISGAVGGNELTITNIPQITFINDDYKIVDNETGEIYRVVERDSAVTNKIILDRVWDGINPPVAVWVIPPPSGGGRWPCVGIYQKVIRF